MEHLLLIIKGGGPGAAAAAAGGQRRQVGGEARAERDQPRPRLHHRGQGQQGAAGHSGHLRQEGGRTVKT